MITGYKKLKIKIATLCLIACAQAFPAAESNESSDFVFPDCVVSNNCLGFYAHDDHFIIEHQRKVLERLLEEKRRREAALDAREINTEKEDEEKTNTDLTR